MFDTMTMTKVVGGVCGALLIFLFGNWAAESIYGFGEKGHGEEATLAYSVAGAEAPAADTAAAAEPAFADLIQVADVKAGEQTFGKCKSCHKVDGNNAVGPHLNGVVGRPRGSVDGFAYSDAMMSKHDPWTEEEIYTFIKAPKVYVPGTKMGFAGLAKPEDRANVVAYLASLK
ncbi:MAG: cytochrome c family protein [Pseudorhodobacter sp.]|nr:cytochrome c family protein [Pseudorhodobacter sp.]